MIDFQVPLPGLARDFNKLTDKEADRQGKGVH